jgi:hypothetical protein
VFGLLKVDLDRKIVTISFIFFHPRQFSLAHAKRVQFAADENGTTN